MRCSHYKHIQTTLDGSPLWHPLSDEQAYGNASTLTEAQRVSPEKAGHFWIHVHYFYCAFTIAVIFQAAGVREALKSPLLPIRANRKQLWTGRGTGACETLARILRTSNPKEGPYVQILGKRPGEKVALLVQSNKGWWRQVELVLSRHMPSFLPPLCSSSGLQNYNPRILVRLTTVLHNIF